MEGDDLKVNVSAKTNIVNIFSFNIYPGHPDSSVQVYIMELASWKIRPGKNHKYYSYSGLILDNSVQVYFVISYVDHQKDSLNRLKIHCRNISRKK